MRIVGGEFGGRRLTPPSDRRVRPTTDRAREALFNTLSHGAAARSGGDPVAGALVLDAFAGTGALGLEALSRGADRAWFFDADRASIALARGNIDALGLQARAIVRQTRLPKCPRAEAACSLAFLDPPYGKGLIAPTIKALAAVGWLAPGAVVVCEHGAGDRVDPPFGFEVVDARRLGSGMITMLSYRPSPAAIAGPST